MFLQAFSSFIPESRSTIEDLKWELGLNKYQAQVFTRFHKLDRIAVAPGLTAQDLLRNALGKLLATSEVVRHEIKYLIYTHTIQTVAPFPINLLEDLVHEYGLVNCAAFSMTMQNCASSIGAIDVARRLLANSESPDDKVIIVAGEKAFTPTVQLIPSTTVMGEASAACLVAQTGGRNRVLNVKQKTLGRFSKGVSLDPQMLRDFESIYASTLRETIEEAVHEAGAELEDIAIIVPHNINVSSWKRVARELGFPPEKIYLENVPKLGHCFCSDVFINYLDVVEEGKLSPGDLYLMIGVGLGATFGVAVVEH